MRNILRMSMQEIGEAIRYENISPVTIVDTLIKRIERINPKVNAFITLAKETAIRRALEVEDEVRKGFYFGPLHGVPIVLKDNIFTKDFPTTMGSEIYRHYFPGSDAFVVEQLRSAGAIIIGKVNTHEFAYGPTGDRSIHGVVKNPYDLSRLAGGSSGGSAAAVAACMAYGALGTDTGGSIRIPASFCGIVGMKPTYGKISKYGIYPLASSLDHVGPMTRTVYDNALMLSILNDFDHRDPDYRLSGSKDYTYHIGKSIKGKVIGIPTSFFIEELDVEIEGIYKYAIRALKNLGAVIKPVHLPDMHLLLAAQRKILQAQAYKVHAENLKKHPNKWDAEVKARVITGKYITIDELARAYEVQKEYQRKFAKILGGVDVLFTPTMTIKAPKTNFRQATGLGEDGIHIRWEMMKLTSPFNVLGLPVLSVPAGFSTDGLPIGVQFIGAEHSESQLYQIGAAFEKEVNVPTAKLAI